MKSLSQLQSDFATARRQMEDLNTKIPRIMGTSAVKVVKENFKLQGYDSGAGIRKWDKRDPETDKAYDRRGKLKGSVYSSSNPLLLQTRNLYNSIKYLVTGKSVRIGVDLNLIPYAEAMNKTRQYIPKENEGPNIKILEHIKKKILSERNRIMKIFEK
jgi:hypothetical protein